MFKRFLSAVVGSLILLVSNGVPLEAAAPSTQPVALTSIELSACNGLVYGFVTGRGHNRPLGRKSDRTCGPIVLDDRTINVDLTNGMVFWLKDTSCGTIYYSDGTGDANHATVTDLGGGRWQVDIADGGGGCGSANSEDLPNQGAGNLRLIYDTSP